MNRIISLFLFIFIASCLNCQYNSPIRNKVTRGKQTTADGLVYRGIRADTASKIVPFSDTSAYIILDTMEKTLWLYKAGQVPKWQQVGGSTLDTATMLLPYYRAGRNDIIQAANVPTLNQNTTGSAATLTTGRTIQTNLSSTSAATFNGSANITPGVTGTLPVANGGTGNTSLDAADIVTKSGTQTIGGAKTFTSAVNAASIYVPSTTFGAIPTPSYQTIIKYGQNNTFAEIQGGNLNLSDFSTFLKFRVNSNTSNTPIDALTLTYTGAATFSSSVTATTGIFTNYANGGLGGASIDNTGQIVRTSSIELKKDITNIKYGLNKILQINPINFNWIDENKFGNENENGFIAEDVMSIIPNVVGSDANGLFMDYTKLIPILTKAIQEQNALIKALEQRILILENK